MTGKLIKGVGGLYIVDAEQGTFECSVRGIFRKRNIVPTVGDFVDIQVIDEKEFKGNIVEIKKRKNSFVRPRVVNVDQTIIVISAINPSINYDLLDRTIVLAEEQGTEIAICINKIDLGNRSEAEAIQEIYTKIGYNVVFTSNTQDQGIEELEQVLFGKTSVFSGLSGVGKSSLTNKVLSENRMATGYLSEKMGKGKHTTRHSELIKINENSFIVDSPGFSSLSLSHIKPRELSNLFREFRAFAGGCRFNDCMHLDEPGCEVKSQQGRAINDNRYNRYINFMAEINSSKNSY